MESGETCSNSRKPFTNNLAFFNLLEFSISEFLVFINILLSNYILQFHVLEAIYTLGNLWFPFANVISYCVPYSFFGFVPKVLCFVYVPDSTVFNYFQACSFSEQVKWVFHVLRSKSVTYSSHCKIKIFQLSTLRQQNSYRLVHTSCLCWLERG